jgi:hypothetical protein
MSHLNNEITLEEAAKLAFNRADALEILAKSVEHQSNYSTGIYNSTTEGMAVKQYLFIANINGRLNTLAIQRILAIIKAGEKPQ